MSVDLDYDPPTAEGSVLVGIETRPRRFCFNVTSCACTPCETAMVGLVHRGLRARPAFDDLLADASIVAHAFVSEAAPAELGRCGRYLVLPTVLTKLELRTASLKGASERFAWLPLAAQIADLRQAAADICVRDAMMGKSPAVADAAAISASQMTPRLRRRPCITARQAAGRGRRTA